MFEEIAYDANGNLLSGTFADYLCPTAPEIPDLVIGHVNTPSPHTALGAKGLGDGSSMLAPAALPMRWPMRSKSTKSTCRSPAHRVWQLAQGKKPLPTTVQVPLEHAWKLDGRTTRWLLQGSGETVIDALARGRVGGTARSAEAQGAVAWMPRGRPCSARRSSLSMSKSGLPVSRDGTKRKSPFTILKRRYHCG